MAARNPGGVARFAGGFRPTENNTHDFGPTTSAGPTSGAPTISPAVPAKDFGPTTGAGATQRFRTGTDANSAVAGTVSSVLAEGQAVSPTSNQAPTARGYVGATPAQTFRGGLGLLAGGTKRPRGAGDQDVRMGGGLSS